MERWKKNLYILWLSQVISLTSFGFGLPFIPFFIQELGVTDPIQLKLYTGILSAAPAITMAIMSPVWGMLSDRFGQKLMIQRAMFTAVLIIGAMGLAGNVWQLVVLRLFQGLFTGTITASSAFVAVNTPNHRLSYALGFLSSSTFVGYSLGPLMGGKVASLYGYRASFLVGAGLMFLGFILVTFFLKEERIKADNTVRGKQKIQWRKVINTSVGMLLVLLFFQRIIRTLFTPFIPLYIQELNLVGINSAELTGYISGLIGFVSALSAVLISRLGDIYPKWKLIKVMLVAGLVMAWLLNATNGLYPFIIFYTVLFFVIGGIEPLLTSAAAEQTPSERRGTLFGIQGLVGSLGWMVSPTIGTYVSIVSGTKAIFGVLVFLFVLNLGIVIWESRNKKEAYL